MPCLLSLNALQSFSRRIIRVIWRAGGLDAFPGVRVNEGLRVGYAVSPRQLLTRSSFPRSGS